MQIKNTPIIVSTRTATSATIRSANEGVDHRQRKPKAERVITNRRWSRGSMQATAAMPDTTTW